MSHPAEESLTHRPWPLPHKPWILLQSWRDLLFMHWRLPASELRDTVPPGLTLERFDGSAWLGLAAFRLTGLRPRFTPSIPGLSTFLELNLRTYVRVGDRSGVFFFSLDAGSRIAAASARTLYRLPYHHAEMEMERQDGWIRYQSRRRDGSAEFEGRYRPFGEPFRPKPGTLEHFLVERYALYVVTGGGRVLRTDIHHEPWSIRAAEARIERNDVPVASGLAPSEEAPLLHFAERQDTLTWPPTEVR